MPYATPPVASARSTTPATTGPQPAGSPVRTSCPAENGGDQQQAKPPEMAGIGRDKRGDEQPDCSCNSHFGTIQTPVGDPTNDKEADREGESDCDLRGIHCGN